MSSSVKNAFLLFFIVFVSSCASQRLKTVDVFETFDTKVFDDGTKEFEYKIVNKRKGKGKGRKSSVSFSVSGRNAENGAESSSENQSEVKDSLEVRQEQEAKLLETLDKKLEQKLKSTGFCREGFLTIEKEAIRGVAYIRGECRELATDYDRKLFPSAPKHQIIEEVLSP